jgi:hypothetical protein
LWVDANINWSVGPVLGPEDWLVPGGIEPGVRKVGYLALKLLTGTLGSEEPRRQVIV